MFKRITLLLFICTSFLHSATYRHKGRVFQEQDIPQLVSLITCVTPDLSIDGTEKLYNSQASLSMLPHYARCKRIMIFKDLPPEEASQGVGFDFYKRGIKNLTHFDPVMRGVELIFSAGQKNLSALIEEALKSVTTPFVFIHFGEWELQKSFNLLGAAATLSAKPFIKYIFLSPYMNQESDWSGPVDPQLVTESFIPLTRSFGWSSHPHFTSVYYYKNKILPICHNTAIEREMMASITNTYAKWGKGMHALYGVYMYGDINDGNYLIEAEARN